MIYFSLIYFVSRVVNHHILLYFVLNFQEKLLSIFPQLKITVSKKADSLFPIVSAASICAKVTRDAALKNWKFIERPGEDIDSNWGSGYPNGKTK